MFAFPRPNCLGLALVGCLSCAVPAAEPPALEIATEGLWASDIRLTQTTGAWNATRGPLSGRLSIVGATLGADFRPAAYERAFFDDRVLDHVRFSAQADAQWRVASRWTLLGGLGGYDGFTGYRSAWVAEYYRQQTAGLPGYRDAEPRGGNLLGGFRYEYLPSAGFLETTFGYSRDVIAPSYDDVIDPDEGLVGYRALRSEINTLNWRVRAEQALSPRVRASMEFRFTSQSMRGPRFTGIGSVNYAPFNRLVLRLDGGYATERFELPTPLPDDPPPVSTRFNGWWLGASADLTLGRGWSIFASGRHYRDTGEIENSISFSSAAPSSRTWQGEAGVRWQSGAHSIRLSGGPYFSDYGAVPFNIQAFGPLYRDRTFTFFQLAYQISL